LKRELEAEMGSGAGFSENNLGYTQAGTALYLGRIRQINEIVGLLEEEKKDD